PSQITRDADVTTFGYNADLEPLQVTQDAADEPGVSGHWYYTDGLTTYLSDSGTHVYRIPVEGVVIGAADSATGEVTYYHYDLLGSVVTTTDAAGNLDAEVRFDAFGKRRLLNGNADANDSLLFGQEDEDLPGFTGHQQRDLAGLVQMNARTYDPVVARFMSVDPLMRDVLDSRSHNAYSYVENSPLTYTDPTGLALDGAGAGGPPVNISVLSGSETTFALIQELALGTERRVALEEYFVGVGRADEIQFAAGPASAALVSDLYTTETGFFDRPLGVPGRIGVAALGGASVVGIGLLLAKTGVVTACVSSVVCAVGVVTVASGALVYDLTHGGAERIRDSFVAFFTKETATVGQSLEVGGVTFGVLGGGLAGGRFALRLPRGSVRRLVSDLGLPVEAQRALLRESLGSTPGSGQVAHHLVPLEAISRFPGLLQKAAQGGFNINGANNGILLNAAEHVGGHPIYNQVVLQELARIPAGLSARQSAVRLQQTADTLRRAIQRGTFGPIG
ncbi:MAG: RHS repeat-associated core domain-containing protein, partial [Pseudomonadota bacterium]